jgi:hypothetical protein
LIFSAKTTTPPLTIKVTSPVTIRLPEQVIKLEAHVEPSNRPVNYQWTYKKNGPVTPTLEVKIYLKNSIYII